MANSEDVVWMACESHLRRFGHVANCAPCLAVTLDYVRAEVRELRVKLDSEAGHRLSLCADNERFVAEVRELRQKPDGELRRDLSDAQQMIVLLMNQREWGSATGALLEDPVVKRAYAAMGGGEGEA